MTTLTLQEPKELMAEHREALTVYARRVFKGEALTAAEEADRARRVEEFFAVGATLGCTGRELTAVLFNELFQTRQTCVCFNCRTRGDGSE